MLKRRMVEDVGVAEWVRTGSATVASSGAVVLTALPACPNELRCWGLADWAVVIAHLRCRWCCESRCYAAPSTDRPSRPPLGLVQGSCTSFPNLNALNGLNQTAKVRGRPEHGLAIPTTRELVGEDTDTALFYTFVGEEVEDQRPEPTGIPLSVKTWLHLTVNNFLQLTTNDAADKGFSSHQMPPCTWL